jgi:hypothetical protein
MVSQFQQYWLSKKGLDRPVLFFNGVYVFLKTYSANGQSYQGMDGGERK